MLARALVIAVAGLMALPAAAQDDDLLAPLVPIPDKKPKAKPKPKPRKKKPRASPDDDLAPLVVTKTRLEVKLTSGVSDAVMEIDGNEAGILPLEAVEVKPGEHTISIKRAGFAPWTRKVKVAAGKTVDLKVDLKAVAAVVSITGSVDGADVRFRGKMLGLTPLGNVEVPPGTGELVVSKAGYKDETQIITFAAGKDYPLRVDLVEMGTTAIVATNDRPVEPDLTPNVTDEPPPLTTTTRVSDGPITTRWYFWAGVAAVGVAVIAGTAVGVSSATAKPTPGKTERLVCEGECYQCIPAGWCDGPVAPGARASAGIVSF